MAAHRGGWLSIALAAAACVAPGPSSGAGPIELNVSAAVSLREALIRIAPACERRAGARLLYNFGASSDLARQIEAGGEADIFFSADEEWMDRLESADLVESASRRSLLSNRLVIVCPEGSDLAVRSGADLTRPEVRRLSLADPRAVPAGKYARAWLIKTGVWSEIESRIVPALDARAALAAVESGAADAGVIYRTDAALSKTVRVVYEVPAGETPAISYCAGVIAAGRHPDAARGMLSCFAAPEAMRIFEELGFIVAGGAGRVPGSGGSK